MSAGGHFREGTRLLTPLEAAEYIHVCEKTLRSLRQQGLIRYVAVTARKKLYRPEDLDAYLSSQVKTEIAAVPTKRRRGRPLRHRANVVSFSDRRKERLAETQR